ncbi:MAG: hypothetical protein ACRDRE_18570 [Pseudonocardiaceae bacterium]
MLLGVLPVSGEGRLAPAMQGEVLIQQLIDGRAGPRVSTLLEFRQEPDSCLFGPPLGTRPRRDDLDEVVPTLGDRVDTGIDPDAQRATGKLVDCFRAAAPAGGPPPVS